MFKTIHNWEYKIDKKILLNYLGQELKNDTKPASTSRISFANSFPEFNVSEMKEKNRSREYFLRQLCILTFQDVYNSQRWIGDRYSHASFLARSLTFSRFLTTLYRRVWVKLASILSLVWYLLSEHVRGRQLKIGCKLRTPKVICTPNSFISHSNMVINLRDKKCTEDRLKNCLHLWDSVTLHWADTLAFARQ